MSSHKVPGNLRDFRIDERQPQHASAVHEPDHPTNVPPPSPLPQQKVKPRQSASLQEWNVANQNLVTESADSLWSSWEQEVGAPVSVEEEINLAQPMPNAIARKPSISQALPANPPVVPEKNQGGQARTEALDPGSLPWAAELAFEERRMERTGTVDYTNQYQKQEILRQRTREFTALLQKQLREHVEIFNESRRSSAHHIHVYKVSKTEEDFMLYRNHVKLVISGQRAGRILFAFNQYMGQIFAPTQAPVVEIEASWGPFDQLFWSFKGERVQVLDLVRYFLTEFVRQSFR